MDMNLPAAKTNWPSLDTLMEVATVGISKSWMSSILRWMSGENIVFFILFILIANNLDCDILQKQLESYIQSLYSIFAQINHTETIKT